MNSDLSQGLIEVDGGIVYSAPDGTDPYCHTYSSSQYSQIDYSGGVFTVRAKNGADMSDHPMVEVSWFGAAAYCKWRSRLEGYEVCYDPITWDCDLSKKGYRLPTEAEWEYAARGGNSNPYYRFPWGNSVSHSQANYYSGHLYSYDVSPTIGCHPLYNDGIHPLTAPTGSFSPNGYGLYDIAGNVWEWCNDWYAYDYYASAPDVDVNPIGPSGGMARIVRGGSWLHLESHCRVATRGNSSPDTLYAYFGFRVVLDLQ